MRRFSNLAQLNESRIDFLSRLISPNAFLRDSSQYFA